MAAFLQTASGDLALVNGNLALCPTIQAEAAQAAFNAFRLWEGEWFLDTSLGVPYFSLILGRKSTKVAAQVLRRVLEDEPTIQSVDAFTVTLNPVTRMLDVHFQATATNGATVTGSVST